MPLQSNHGLVDIDLDSREGVAELIQVARDLDLEKSFLHVLRRRADIADHLMYLSVTNREWFEPYRDEAVVDLADRLSFNVSEAALLLAGTSEDAIDVVVRRLNNNDGDVLRDLVILAGIGSESSLTAVADFVRAAGAETDKPVRQRALLIANNSGVHVGPSGPAITRFVPDRWALMAGTDASGTSHGQIGIDLGQIAAAGEPVTWHYLSFEPNVCSTLPEWPFELLHVVAPRSYWFTATANVSSEGKYQDVAVTHDGELFDVGLEEIEMNIDAHPTPPGPIHVRPYDAELVYRNAHIMLTDGALGTVGGVQLGLSIPPICDGCEVLMFHAASMESSVREYGDGFRSVFYCPECVKVALTGSNWN